MIHATDVGSNALRLLLLGDEVVLPAVLVQDELFDIGGVKLIPLVFALDVEAGGGLDVREVVPVEAVGRAREATGHSLVHTKLVVLLLLHSKVDS